MTDVVQLTKDKDIAIITINNSPVNALSPGVPEGISGALDEIVRDASIKAAVLIGPRQEYFKGSDRQVHAVVKKRQGGRAGWQLPGFCRQSHVWSVPP
jgi:enoyl-CoA hydratase/carnithine racemase